MELELGLKLSNIMDDFAAAELLIAKDRAGPLFLCTQTDSIFFITAHLKGYTRKDMKIEINHDGSRIGISGEKPVQEMVMAGWQVVKKEVVMRGFRKTFKIPVGVILDKIKARFNEDESVLTISLPKLVKGVVNGVGVEELKGEEMPKGRTKSLHVFADEDNVSEGVRLQQEECSKPKSDELYPTKAEIVRLNGSDLKKTEGENGNDLSENIEKGSKEMGMDVATRVELPSIAPRLEKEFQEKGTQTDQEFQEKGTQTDQKITRDIQEQKKTENDQDEITSLTELTDEPRVVHGQEDVRTEQSIHEEKEADDEPYTEEKGKEVHEQSSDKDRQRKSKKICAPVIIVGSTVIVSLVVLVIHLIKSNNQTRKRETREINHNVSKND